MLSNKKVSVMADTVIGSTKVATYSAIISVDTTEMTVTTRYPSAEVYEANKTTIEADRDAFVEFASGLQNSLTAEN